MAAHVETGAMAHSEHYSSKQLNHLGLVAGMYDELGIGELIDQLIIQDGDKRIVSLGQAVKGMILNGLGFTHRALYLTPLFFRDKPVDRLIGEGIEAVRQAKLVISYKVKVLVWIDQRIGFVRSNEPPVSSVASPAERC